MLNNKTKAALQGIILLFYNKYISHLLTPDDHLSEQNAYKIHILINIRNYFWPYFTC